MIPDSSSSSSDSQFSNSSDRTSETTPLIGPGDLMSTMRRTYVHRADQIEPIAVKVGSPESVVTVTSQLSPISDSRSLISVTSLTRFVLKGYTDVGDGSWRRNMLVISLGCW